jgi:NAD(P)-dependent dehydrogenase (short-subunit alcohol dehydrogenase family)
MSDPLDMKGKSVIVTGGSGGVGWGITTRFFEAGADVVICDLKEPAELPSQGERKALYIKADVRDPEEIERVVGFAKESFGSLDVLVNNAGGSPPTDAATVAPKLSESIIRLNLIGPMHFSQKANAVMQEQDEGGVIINIASVSAVRPSPGTAAYAAAKAGLLSLTQTLAVEWAPKVRVNAVTSGMILTELSRLHYGDGEGVAAVAATVPLGRMGLPRDVADICLFLASPLASYVSGAGILMHGGGEKPAFLAAAKGTKP